MTTAARPRPRPAHRRAAQAGQRAFIVFGGEADLPWLRLLRPGYRHCFAAIADASGWTVLDLPGFYRRAGFAVAGPFTPGPARWRPLPPLSPFTCVALCRAVLGAGAPFAVTPWGLFRKLAGHRKNILTPRCDSGKSLLANGRTAP
ncbi:MAG: hypothetical protein AAGC69_10985 [Paracraurococcus sp.]